MPQLLHLQNGESVVQKLRSADGRLAKLLKEKKADDAVIDELFLAALARLPNAAQRAVIKKALADGDRDEAFRAICDPGAHHLSLEARGRTRAR